MPSKAGCVAFCPKRAQSIPLLLGGASACRAARYKRHRRFHLIWCGQAPEVCAVSTLAPDAREPGTKYPNVSSVPSLLYSVRTRPDYFVNSGTEQRPGITRPSTQLDRRRQQHAFAFLSGTVGPSFATMQSAGAPPSTPAYSNR